MKGNDRRMEKIFRQYDSNTIECMIRTVMGGAGN